MHQKSSDFHRISLIRSLSLLAAVIYPLIQFLPVYAQENIAVVRPDPSTMDLGLGQVETIDIVIEDAQQVYGIDVRAHFDPSVIEVVDSDSSTDGIQMIPGKLIQPDFKVRNSADNQAGTLQYVITQVNPTPPANGTGIVFSVQFRGKALGKKSALIIDSVDIADRRGIKLKVQPQNGDLEVVPPKPPTPTAPVDSPATTETRTPISTVTIVASDITQPPPTSAAPILAKDGSTLTDTALVGIAIGGFIGAVILLGVAVVYLRRK